jgi:hypothetical protein
MWSCAAERAQPHRVGDALSSLIQRDTGRGHGDVGNKYRSFKRQKGQNVTFQKYKVPGFWHHRGVHGIGPHQGVSVKVSCMLARPCELRTHDRS